MILQILYDSIDSVFQNHLFFTEILSDSIDSQRFYGFYVIPCDSRDSTWFWVILTDSNTSESAVSPLDHIVFSIERFHWADNANDGTSPLAKVEAFESPAQSKLQLDPSNSTCRVCSEVFSTKGCLFAHSRVSGHYAEVKVVYGDINQSVQYIDNPRDRKKVQFHCWSMPVYSIHPRRPRSNRLSSTQSKWTTRDRSFSDLIAKQKNKRPPSLTFVRNSFRIRLLGPLNLHGDHRRCCGGRRTHRAGSASIRESWAMRQGKIIIDCHVSKRSSTLSRGAKYVTKLDFHGGYHQIPIDECDKPKTAFVTPDG